MEIPSFKHYNLLEQKFILLHGRSMSEEANTNISRQDAAYDFMTGLSRGIAYSGTNNHRSPRKLTWELEFKIWYFKNFFEPYPDRLNTDWARSKKKQLELQLSGENISLFEIGCLENLPEII